MRAALVYRGSHPSARLHLSQAMGLYRDGLVSEHLTPVLQPIRLPSWVWVDFGPAHSMSGLILSGGTMAAQTLRVT